jgi:hypothetical protein
MEHFAPGKVRSQKISSNGMNGCWKSSWSFGGHMIAIDNLREIVRPVLTMLGMWSPAAEELVIGTIAKESHLLKWDKQICGPAVGACQMEPETEYDIWHRWLFPRRPDLVTLITSICGATGPNPARLRYDLIYNIIMCRLRYYRVPEPLPESHDVQALADYWKIHFNTYKGKGKPEEFVELYYTLVVA